MKSKHKTGRNKKLYVLAIAAIVVAVIAIFMPAPKTQDKLDKILQEFHKNGSEAGLKTYFPDASMIFSEQRNKSSFNYSYPADENRTIIYKYYFLKDENKTVIACDRNVTIAVCPGKVDTPLTADDVAKCLVDNSTAFSLTGKP